MARVAERVNAMNAALKIQPPDSPMSDLQRRSLVKFLNDTLATTLMSVMRSRRHHFLCASLGGATGLAASAELLRHAHKEMGHADLVVARILQLGGRPDFDTGGRIERGHPDCKVSGSLAGMLKEDLWAQRLAVDAHGRTARFIGDNDPTTRRLFDWLGAQGEAQAGALESFLNRLADD